MRPSNGGGTAGARVPVLCAGAALFTHMAVRAVPVARRSGGGGGGEDGHVQQLPVSLSCGASAKNKQKNVELDLNWPK